MSRLHAKFTLLLLATALLFAACGDDEGEGEGEGSAQATSSTTSSPSSSATTEPEAPDGPTCKEVPSPEPKKVNLDAPSAKAPTASEVVFDTSCGEFTVALDGENNPKTAASFEYLAKQGAFDGTPFHRVVPGFVIQGGDPLGTGLGDAGFSIDEKPPADTEYTKGVVAMAKAGTDPPGRSGSQFFVVSGADAGLPPDYAVAGEITDGIDVVAAIEALGQPSDPNGTPIRPVVINSATAR